MMRSMQIQLIERSRCSGTIGLRSDTLPRRRASGTRSISTQSHRRSPGASQRRSRANSPLNRSSGFLLRQIALPAGPAVACGASGCQGANRYCYAAPQLIGAADRQRCGVCRRARVRKRVLPCQFVPFAEPLAISRKATDLTCARSPGGCRACLGIRLSCRPPFILSRKLHMCVEAGNARCGLGRNTFGLSTTLEILSITHERLPISFTSKFRRL